MGYAKTMMLVYNVLGMAPFVLMPADILRDSWKGIKEAECPRRGPCIPTLEWTTGLIFFQVIVCMAFQYAAIIYAPGKKGIVGALVLLILTMAKHITVDGLIPPPPVMVMTALVFIAQFAAPPVWAKRAYVAYALLNSVTFVTQPLMVLQDTFPAITPESEAFKLGKLLLEVCSLYQVMCAIVASLPGTTLGLAYAWQAGLPILMKHVMIDKSGPPAPMICLYIATLAVAWYEVGWADFSKKADKAFRTPMKLHAIILATGFVPWFIAEMIGFPFPFFGMGDCDTSYKFTGAASMLMGMLAIFSTMVAYEEYKGVQESKLFAVYHYFLSAFILFYQCQPSTTLIGTLFFMPPHMFTAWCAYIVVSEPSHLKKE
jgi:hypothetical protein